MSAEGKGRYPLQVLLTTVTSHLLVTASYSSLAVFDLHTQTLVATATPHTALVRLLTTFSSPTREYLVTSGEDKLLNVLALPSLELLSTRELPKRANAIEVTEGGEIVVGDKFGDVYLYPLIAPPPIEGNEKKDVEKPQPIMGHVSMLNALALIPSSPTDSNPSALLVTGDRDEHIRVSRFPQAFMIENYLWSSKKFVATLLYLPSRCTIPGTPPLLLAAGGDPTIHVFNPYSGELLSEFPIEDVLLPFVVVAPSAPEPVVSTKVKTGKKGKGKQVAETSQETGEEATESVSEAVKASDGDMESEPAKENRDGKDSDVTRIRTMGPHAWKDGLTTALAVIKIVKFGQGVVVLAAGSTALLYIPFSLLLPTSTSQSGKASTLNFHHPILDISLAPSSSISSEASEFFVSLDLSRSVPSALEELSSPVQKVGLNSIGGLESLALDAEFVNAVEGSMVPLSPKLAFPPIASLYPVLSLLILSPDPTDQAGPDDALPAVENEEGFKAGAGTEGGKKRGRVELEQQKSRKKGKRHEAREKLQEDLKTRENEKAA